MSLYEKLLYMQLLKRPFRIGSNAWYAFVSGPKTGKPFKVKFESSTACNLRCVMCPLTKGLSRKKGVLSFNNFKKVYDEIKVPYLNLTGLGEPLLNPEIFKIITYARKKGSLVKIDTNATLFNKDVIKRLIEADPTIISVSIDGINKKSYEAIRKGAKFEEVIKNLKDLIDYRNNVKSKIQVHLFFVLQKENIKDLIDFIKFGDSLNVDAINGNIAISFGKADNDDFRKIDLKDLEKIKQDLLIIKKNIKVQLNIENIEDFIKNPVDQEKRISDEPCFYPWYNPCITWDGYVVPCDIHCDNEIVFGNAFKEPFMKIWNNKKAQEFRKQLLRKRIGVCSKCCVEEKYLYNKFKPFYKIPIINKFSYRK
ncbi:MAG: radical SAM protein [archaeon]